MNVERVMKPDVKSCSTGDNLNRAAQLMWENACGCIPVTDHSSKIVGMLTDRDICMAAYTQGRPLDSIAAETSMARKVVTCRVDDDVTTAIHLMRETGVRRLPVVDEHGSLRGIVSLDDLAGEALRNLRGAINQDLANELGEAFLAIAARRIRRAPG
jgi:CBS domain-containing protein